MADLKIKINNYKLIEDREEEFKDARILLITGKNEIGKTTYIRGIIENLTAKAQTDEPVTRGKQSGSKTYTLPDKNGNMVTIHHEFSVENPKGSFYAIDHLGKKISSVIKIRELMGVFEELPVDTFYTLAQTAEGRKKIIEKYFYPLLLPEQKDEILDIDKQTKRGGEIFDRRTEINTEIKYIQSQLKANEPSDEDKTLAEEYENILKEIENIENEKSKVKTKIATRDQILVSISQIEEQIKDAPQQVKELQDEAKETIQENLTEIERLEERIKSLKEKNIEIQANLEKKTDAIFEEEKQLKEKLANLNESLTSTPDVTGLNQYDENLKEMKEFRDKAFTAKNKLEAYEKDRKSIEAKFDEQQNLEKKIETLRQRKKDILAKSKLPKGLTIDNDEFTWNDFKFSDTQISKSSALLIISEILCNIVESKIVYLGEKALFDKQRFKELVEIAEKYGKIPVLEQVIDERTEIKVITELYE